LVVHPIRLIIWNEAEAAEKAIQLRASGYEVDHAPLDGVTGLRQLRETPPAAVVIDLTRLPSQGVDVALAIRKYKSTRHLPLLFVGGAPQKVDRIRKLLPDAVYTTWVSIGQDLRRAITHPPADPVVPQSLLDAYASTPLARKLGIKANSIVVLIDAPKDFEKTVGTLPKGARFSTHAKSRRDLTIWFVRSKQELRSGIRQMVPFADKGGLWIVWPKKTSAVAADFSQVDVRESGLAEGLVDYKVCAVDSTWSGLRFTRRKSN
jgi:hypothetical protein